MPLRPFLRPWSRRATVFAAIALLDIPLISLSVRLLPDAHPASIPLTPEMRITLGAWFVLFSMVSVMLTLVPTLPAPTWTGRSPGTSRCV